MELESNLELEMLEIIKNHKEEILKDTDWWHGLDNYDLNVFQEIEEDEFKAIVYKVDLNGDIDYSYWYNIPSNKLNEILFFKGENNGN